MSLSSIWTCRVGIIDPPLAEHIRIQNYSCLNQVVLRRILTGPAMNSNIGSVRCLSCPVPGWLSTYFETSFGRPIYSQIRKIALVLAGLALMMYGDFLFVRM
ncbi:hypothetical protein BDV28DRAFT_30325 [Aspergillus coremiiformis]|uniref:Uncharacterized protein n=1 Tax=Aspergillus coremiiformis TaxID=138285 RepID=A0A5N6YZJ4_9EURO|nr:hypothetical protein BDV28DRAFT_30325 [Aspergillus coremiiformis]